MLYTQKLVQYAILNIVFGLNMFKELLSYVRRLKMNVVVDLEIYRHVE